MIWIILSICIVLFLISFSILFKAQIMKCWRNVKKFFSKISKKIFKKKKPVENRRRRFKSSEVQKRPVLLAPTQPLLEMKEKNNLENKEPEKSALLSGTFKTPQKFQEETNLEKRKEEIKKFETETVKSSNNKIDFDKIDKMIEESARKRGTIPLENHFKKRVSGFPIIEEGEPIPGTFAKNSALTESSRRENFLTSARKEREYKKIMEENLEELKFRLEKSDFKKLKKDSVVVDGVEIDLQKLPPNLRRLFLSGILERPKF